MFKFLKKNIFYISLMISFMEILTCWYNKVGISGFCVFLMSGVIASIFFFIDCKLINKGYISDKSVMVLFFVLLASFLFCILGFIFKDKGYTVLSIFMGVFSILEFILIRIFDIEMN